MRGSRQWALLAVCLCLAAVVEGRRKLKRDHQESLRSADDDAVDEDGEDVSIDLFYLRVFKNVNIFNNFYFSPSYNPVLAPEMY